ncbi:MAG: hypothetical protein AB2609_15915, partial [Candidatus Thiodiazotropha sp.]
MTSLVDNDRPRSLASLWLLIALFALPMIAAWVLFLQLMDNAMIEAWLVQAMDIYDLSGLHAALA